MRILLTLAAFAAFMATASAQTTAYGTTGLKEHVCTATCTAYAHAYVHGEQGHTCTAACTAATVKAGACCVGKQEGGACTKSHMNADPSTLKVHACSTDCKEGKHVVVHGERGHPCNTACMRKH
ncbi:MAG: hypothetical protein IPJ76_02635 [Flavobacteriales bacterium]|nr:MAG: hypothetical protein IPJ76_02635 [Flavobacteriales bacterium]